MANKNFKIILHPISSANYKKPNRSHEFVEDKAYDKVDQACEQSVKIGNEGKAYVNKEIFSDLFRCSKADGEYIYGVKIKDDAKRTYGNEEYAHSSAVVAELDKTAQETRSTEKQAICKYSRDSLISIGDSDFAEKKRRQFDEFADKEMKKLSKERRKSVSVDEITGDPLEEGYEFHHTNKKAIITDPERSIDPDGGILVNKNTHKKIHGKKIVDENQLESLKSQIIQELKEENKKG